MGLSHIYSSEKFLLYPEALRDVKGISLQHLPLSNYLLNTKDCVPSILYQAPCIKYSVPSTVYQVLCTKHCVPSTVLGSRDTKETRNT